MGIAKQSIEDLKSKSKISDFILSSTTGKLRGNKGMALCPFHGEKTASMSFTDEENLFHCFGCKEGGDIFKYIQLINGVEFQESVEIVADKYSFNLTYTDSKFETNQKNLIDKLNKITDYFIRNMNELKSDQAVAYLKSRQLEGEDIKNYKLGFAEKDEKKIIEYCKNNNISDSDFKKLGLFSEKGNFLFKNRIIFPITNFRSEVVGFGGRALEDYGPKYLNSSESSIYKKNRTLYFLPNFLKDIKKNKFAIIVEGYFDVIAFNKLGYSNVASPSGTALTIQQLSQISKYTDEIYLCFDNDDAGIEATKRIVEIKNNISKDINLYTILLPTKYKDISDFYESGDKNIDEILSNKQDLIEFCIDHLIKKEGEADKKKIFTAYKKFSIYLSPLEKDLSTEYLGKKLSINKETLINELSYKDELITTTFSENEEVDTNKHIETFKDIFISSLIKNNYALDDKGKEILEVSTELNEHVNNIKKDLNSVESDKYQNISFSEEQLVEAKVRLILFYSELKIHDLINEIDLSKDTSLFPKVEELKKKIEFYQNTL
ncbi:MAG: DNA primase [Actinomycetota bacterium]|nr:DNA primase [Actinomycetota bacterium]